MEPEEGLVYIGLGLGSVVVALVTASFILIHRALKGDLGNPWLTMFGVGWLLYTVFAGPLLFAIGLGLYLAYLAVIRGLTRGSLRVPHLQDEARARALLARDPDALVGYERLADALEAQHRWAEALDALEAWRERDPENLPLAQRIARLRYRVAPPIEG